MILIYNLPQTAVKETGYNSPGNIHLLYSLSSKNA